MLQDFSVLAGALNNTSWVLLQETVDSLWYMPQDLILVVWLNWESLFFEMLSVCFDNLFALEGSREVFEFVKPLEQHGGGHDPGA